ncbi:hypothetical protein ACFSGI_20110 [Paenibacillus nicotianae]|uniref:Uncharacterized protein n=1 Tax=Paenibacillus nicotianae TaxID=1526551 RepID=A0ABW4V3U7_9BACL
MRIYVTVKSLGKRKNALTREPLDILQMPITLRDFLTEVVKENVRAFTERQQQSSLLSYLTPEQVTEQGEAGKVGFRHIHDDRVPDESSAIEAALLAFEDGLYKVFIGEQEIEHLDDAVQLSDGDDVAFIRFTMLAGSLW